MIAGWRKLSRVHPSLRPAARLLFETAEENGLSVEITSVFRSPADQERVCRTTKLPCATPGRSAHQHGLAIDFVAGGSTGSAQHRALVELAKELGFRTIPGDPVHIEHPQWPAVKRYLFG